LGLEEAEKRKEFLLFTDNLGFFKPFQTGPYSPFSYGTLSDKLVLYKL